MIESNNYLIMDFVYWAQKERTIGKAYFNDEIINSYIEIKCKRWNLRFFLKLFQDYTENYPYSNNIIDEMNIFNELNKFCNEKNSLMYINPLTLSRKKIFLKPLFIEFLNFLEDEKKLHDINEKMLLVNKKFFSGNINFGTWLEEIVQVIKINNLFEIFITNTINAYEINEYLSWISDKNRGYLGISENYSIPTIKFLPDKELLSKAVIDSYLKDDTKKAFYNLVYPPKKESKFSLKEENYFEDFVYYLVNKEIKLNKPFSDLGLEQLLDEYCNYNKKTNKKRLMKSLISKNEGFLQKIKNILSKEKGTRFSLERLESVKMHGFFMFPDSHNLSSFLRINFNNLHNMTGDTLDIYYSRNDLKLNTDCYEKIKEFSYLKIKEKCTPSFIVWDKDGSSIETINLQKLDHEEIRMVIERLVNLAETYCYNDCINLIKKYIEDLKQQRGIYIINNAPINQQNIGNNNNNIITTPIGNDTL